MAFWNKTNPAKQIAPTSEAAGMFMPGPEPAKEVLALREQKQADLDNASATAHADGPPPDYTDFLLTVAKRAQAANPNLTPAEWRHVADSAVDLSSTAGTQPLRIFGFDINQTQTQPNPEIMQQAYVRSYLAFNQNTPAAHRPTFPVVDQMTALQALQQGAAPPEESMMYLYSLKDDMIGPLFEAVDHQAKYHGTVFEKCNFHPAGTLMRDTDGLAITDKATFIDSVFDGMGPDDRVCLRPGHYQGISVVNSNGGTLEFGDGSHSDGVTLKHGTIYLEVAPNPTDPSKPPPHASLSNLVVEDGMKVLDMRVGIYGEVSNSVIHGTTISMHSELQGSTWNKVTFNRTNLVHTEFDRATLSQVNFSNCSMTGASFKDATLSQVSADSSSLKGADLRGANIKDMLITIPGKAEPIRATAEQLRIFGAMVDGATIDGVKVAQSEDVLTQLASATGVTGMFKWQPDPKFVDNTANPEQQKANANYNLDGSLTAAGQADVAHQHTKKIEVKDRTPPSMNKNIARFEEPVRVEKPAPGRVGTPTISDVLATASNQLSNLPNAKPAVAAAEEKPVGRFRELRPPQS